MNWLVPSGIASLMDELSAAESRGSPAAASIIRASWNSLTGTVNEPVTLSSAYSLGASPGAPPLRPVP